MPTKTVSKRVTCRRCFRAGEACYCHLIELLDNRLVEVVILRHSDETGKPLGTARIIELSLNNCTLLDGVDFSKDKTLKAIIDRQSSDRIAVLYPGSESTKLSEWVSTDGIMPVDSKVVDEKSPYTLVVLDGTWRNTREILLCTPIIASLPKVTMAFPKSRYIVRKAPSGQCVSTVEAVTYFLDAFYGGERSFLAMLNAFDYMVAYQIKRMGKEIFQANYL